MIQHLDQTAVIPKSMPHLEKLQHFMNSSHLLEHFWFRWQFHFGLDFASSVVGP